MQKVGAALTSDTKRFFQQLEEVVKEATHQPDAQELQKCNLLIAFFRELKQVTAAPFYNVN